MEVHCKSLGWVHVSTPFGEEALVAAMSGYIGVGSGVTLVCAWTDSQLGMAGRRTQQASENAH